jgi:hypothetical protein
MNASSEKTTVAETSQDFRDRQHEKGLFEVRGAFAKKEDHQDIKKIIKAFDHHKTKLMLFLNSLE